MTVDELKALQAPLKQKYRDDPSSALVVLEAKGRLDPQTLECQVTTPQGIVTAGLHPAAGGNGLGACSGVMLLEALVACAGVTLSAVATAMVIELKGGTLTARGTMDFRGTLGVSRETPVGLTAIELTIALDSPAEPGQLDKLVELTERYCVIYQTLRAGTMMKTIRK